MKIVINRKWFGLQLNSIGCKRYAELTGINIDEDLSRKLERHDVALVKIIEENNVLPRELLDPWPVSYGYHYSHDRYDVVEIPDGVEYEICAWECGPEEIHEKHRVWK